MLAQFSSVDEVKTALHSIRIIGIDEPGSTSTVHWRIGDSTGKQAVLEIVDGIPHFYDNPVGVLTNSPGFEWHLTQPEQLHKPFSGRCCPTHFKQPHSDCFRGWIRIFRIARRCDPAFPFRPDQFL